MASANARPDKRPRRKLQKKALDRKGPTYLRESTGWYKDISLTTSKHVNSVESVFPLSAVILDPETYLLNQEDLLNDDDNDIKNGNSRRFKRFWASLTNAQKQALRLVYIDNTDKLTKTEVAKRLGIRVDTLHERIQCAIKKFKKFFSPSEGRGSLQRRHPLS